MLEFLARRSAVISFAQAWANVTRWPLETKPATAFRGILSAKSWLRVNSREKMEEIINITQKYQPSYIEESFRSLRAMHVFSAQFVKDVADLYDALTRIRNVERNSSGFSLDDAPILGLLVRISKLLREIVGYYEKDNAEIIGILERPLAEAAPRR